MHKSRFWSVYAPYIGQFIELKRNLGFKYNTEATILSIFDRFVTASGETRVGLTREFSEKWCERRNNESVSYRFHRCICVNQLSDFLSKLGMQSYIAPLPRVQSSFVPYIYSSEEIASLFNASDGLRVQRRMMNTMLFIMPALLRLLYSTGLRISKALSIRNKDIDLTECCMIIQDSKNGKQRMLPFSESLAEVLREYVYYRNRLPLSLTENDYFFLSLDGSNCSTDIVHKWFRILLKRAQIPYTGHNHGPRVHDLRHTFAVHSLAKMAEQGIDLYCKLPVLSVFLGHQSLNSTNAYVRLTSEMYPGLLKSADIVCLNVFPDLTNYENN